MPTMFSCPMRFTARASSKKRATTFASAAMPSCRNFTATRLPMTGCSARYTVPIPPRPRSFKI